MEKKRCLTNGELNRIRHEEDMLKGNINRMCVADDFDELVNMFNHADSRIKAIFSICLDKFIDDEESEDNVCKGCYYNDGDVHAKCVICDKAESEVR